MAELSMLARSLKTGPIQSDEERAIEARMPDPAASARTTVKQIERLSARIDFLAAERRRLAAVRFGDEPMDFVVHVGAALNDLDSAIRELRQAREVLR